MDSEYDLGARLNSGLLGVVVGGNDNFGVEYTQCVGV